MRNFEFDELIEKVFSIGYECALEDLEEQREFARSDYEGLTKKQKELLRQGRRNMAIDLLKNRETVRDSESRDDSYSKWLKRANRDSEKLRKKIEKEFPAKMDEKSRNIYNKYAAEIGYDRKEDRDLEIMKDNIKHRDAFKERLSEFKKRKETEREKELRRKALIAAGIGAGVLGTAGAGIYAYKKWKNNKKRKEQEENNESSND
jgi:hypothetical protein